MRLAAFYLLLLAGQGFLSALSGTFPAPDLFLVALLTWMGRMPAWGLVAAGYGVGLLQDLVGFGPLGLHAIGLAGAALLASAVRAQLTGSGLPERLLQALAACVGKWLVMAVVLVWLSGPPAEPLTLLAVAVTETVLTVATAALLLPWAERLLDRSRVLRKELL